MRTTIRKSVFSRKALRTLVCFLQTRSERRRCLLISVLFPALIAIGSWVDNTWAMPGRDKGFSQYYGFWVIFATTPTIIFLTSYLFEFFRKLIKNPERYCVNLTSEMSARLQRLIRRHSRGLELRSKTAWIFGFIILVFFMWWMFNLINTVSPTPLRTFHHDVFDSSNHRMGFLIVRIYVFLVFMFVYAPAVFLALHVTASMISILKFLYKQDILYVNFFHEDNCGGTSEFGKVNLLILGIYGAFFAIICAQYFTHQQAYLVIVVSLLACSILALIQSVAAVYYIHKVVHRKKHECIRKLGLRLNEQLLPSLGGEQFPSELLAFRKHLMEIHTLPYNKEALIGVNIIRFAPVVIAIIGYLKRAK